MDTIPVHHPTCCCDRAKWADGPDSPESLRPIVSDRSTGWGVLKVVCYAYTEVTVLLSSAQIRLHFLLLQQPSLLPSFLLLLLSWLILSLPPKEPPSPLPISHPQPILRSRSWRCLDWLVNEIVRRRTRCGSPSACSALPDLILRECIFPRGHREIRQYGLSSRACGLGPEPADAGRVRSHPSSRPRNDILTPPSFAQKRRFPQFPQRLLTY
jgi:hypothetical protein